MSRSVERGLSGAFIGACAAFSFALGCVATPVLAQSAPSTPSSVITSPLTGATPPINDLIVIQGTASDTNGGAVAGVGVSTDGGMTWSLATGTTTWTYVWSPTAQGPVQINSQAFDTNGNYEVPGTGPGVPNVAMITVAAPVCPCSVFQPDQAPLGPISNDGTPIEAGMQFVPAVNGYITALSYYKPAGIGGTRTGNLWTSTGTNLASQVYTNESASGWQQVVLSTPVPVTAGTPYVVSYFSSTGDYLSTADYFLQQVGTGLVQGLAEGANGPNGVFQDTPSSTFPTTDAGGANYYADVVFNTTTLLSQTISFPAIANQVLGAVPFTPPVSASSGLPVSLTSLSPGTCTVNGTAVTLTAVGSCTLTASQPGDGVTYDVAIPVTQTFLIAAPALLNQTITFPTIAKQTLGAAPFAVAVSASSGLPVTLTSQTPTTCTVSGTTITLLGVGGCTLTANQPGDGVTYAAAAPVSQTFQINAALLSQTITFPAIASQTLGAPPFTATVSASSGLPVTLTSQTPTICAVSGTTITLLGVGGCMLTANQPGDGVTYAAAAPVSQTFQINAALLSQTITFPAIASQTLGAAPFTATVSASSGLPVTLTSQSATTCSVSGTTITLLGVGICTLTANQPGDGVTWSAAPPVTQMFSIGPAQVAQTITFPAVASHTVGAGPFTVTVSASSGLPVSLTSQTTGVCTVSGSTVTSVTSGTCTLTASQAGNGSYFAATPVAQSFVITTPSDSKWIVENRSQLTQSFTTAMASTFTVTKYPFFFQLDCAAVVNCYDANPAGPEAVPNFSANPNVPQQNSDWLLSTDALVLVVETPPTMTYFGITPYLFDQYYSTKISTNPTGTPGTVTVFESLTDTANLDVVGTTGSTTPGTNVFTQLAVFVITGDSNTYNDIEKEFVALGFPASAINLMTLPISAVPLKMGTATADDTFTVLLRTAYAANQNLLNNYTARTPIDLLLLQPIKARTLVALPAPTYRVPGDGHNESATLGTAQKQLVTTLLSKFSANYTYTSAKPTIVQTNNYLYSKDALHSNGDNPDALYTQDVGFTSSYIPGPNDLLLVVGVNHDAYYPGTTTPGTGTTTYFSNSVVNPSGNQEVLGLPDSWMAGSAIAMAGITSKSPLYATYQSLYAYTVGYNCAGQVWCATIPQPGGGNAGVPLGDPMCFVGRLYLDPLTKTRPEASEILFEDVYILKHK